MENKKKTKGFVETPEILVKMMHDWLHLRQGETLADFTAGKGKLFLDYNPDLCYGIEIDEENYNHTSVKYKNVLLGDFFEKINDHQVIDALILNPPYIKSSNEIIYRSLSKLKEGGRFAIISKDNTIKEFNSEYPDCNINISMALTFDTNLFKPFAMVKTILIFGVKGQYQGEYSIWDFSNDQIQVNTRSRFVELKLLQPKRKRDGNSDFWEMLNYTDPVDTRPTIADFEKTIIDYMAWDTGFPAEFIRNPKKLWEGYAKLMAYGKK